HHTLPANLQKETGVPDERHAKLTVRHELWFVGLSRTRSHCRVPHQTREFTCAPTKSPISERSLQHSLFDSPGHSRGSRFRSSAIKMQRRPCSEQKSEGLVISV